MTASLRILTVFPFHSPAGKHLYATNTLQYFVSRCPHCSNDCRACQPGESALEVLPYHCLSDHRTGCGTARCTPSKRESIQNDRKVVSPLVAAHLLLLCPPYHMNSDRPIQRACRFILFRATVPAGNCQYSPWRRFPNRKHLKNMPHVIPHFQLAVNPGRLHPLPQPQGI